VAASSYNRSLAFVLKYEGGYVNHPADPGGPTNLGVTQQTLSNYLGRPASIEEVKALTPGKVGPIYKKRYWDAVRGNDLPAGLDLVVFDFAVNSGPARATKALQKLVGVAQDGVMGMDTVAAVEREDAEDLIRRYCANRLAFLKGLTTWGTFVRSGRAGEPVWLPVKSSHSPWSRPGQRLSRLRKRLPRLKHRRRAGIRIRRCPPHLRPRPAGSRPSGRSVQRRPRLPRS
jgi:hypothetical protein